MPSELVKIPAEKKPIEKMTLADMAAEIAQILSRYEKDGCPGIHLHSPTAYRRGRNLLVRYTKYHMSDRLTKEQARHYLAWLRNGNVGSHREAGIDVC
jgi:hypothetical protein